MWKLNHTFWTIVHDIIAHPFCGLLWAINQPVSNRIGYWLHDITLPETWQRSNDGRRIPVA